MAIGGAGSTPGAGSAFDSLRIAASGLRGQRARIDVIAENIANADVRMADGTPYRRKVVELREVDFAETLADIASDRTGPAGGVEVAGIVEDATPGVMVYDPAHPDADENGMVERSNVNTIDEMVDLMDARQQYEANATVFDAVKAVLKRATQL